MIPIITGVIASSIAASSIYSFNGQADCMGGSPVTVYATSPALIYGVVLYQDAELITTYSGLFLYGGLAYVVSNGDITNIATEFTTGTYSTYSGCFDGIPSGIIWIPSGNLSSGAVYTACYADDSTLAKSQFYNIDNSGSNLIANCTITTDGSGIIITNQLCE